MSFIDEIFTWAEKFDQAVEQAKESGKTSFKIEAPKSKTTKEMQEKVVARIGHKITNPKGKIWNVKLDVTTPKDFQVTVIKMK
jgi:hypothetical protein